VVVEDQLVREAGVDEVAASRVEHAFGLAGGAAGVEDEERVLRVHHFRFARLRRARNSFVVPNVAAFGPGDVAPGAAHHEHGLHAGAAFEGLVGVVLEWDGPPTPQPFVGGDDHRRVTVEDAVGQ
jgi:hypothetical protein